MDFWECIPRTSVFLEELNNVPSSEPSQSSAFQGFRLKEAQEICVYLFQFGNGVALKGLEIQAVHYRIPSLEVQSGSLFGARPRCEHLNLVGSISMDKGVCVCHDLLPPAPCHWKRGQKMSQTPSTLCTPSPWRTNIPRS